VLETGPTRQVVSFGAFEADLRSCELRKAGIRIKIQEQPFRVLQILLEHAGEMVTREELQRRIWPSDTFVDFDRGLNNAVKRLREALGDSAETPRYIETLARRGYRFLASVNVAPNGARDVPSKSPENAAKPHTPPGSVKRTIATAAVVAIAAILAVLLILQVAGVHLPLSARPAVPKVRSLAVLPLTNLSGDPAQEYFADGMTDALITELSHIGSLKVISRTTMMRYKRSGLPPLPQIARELNVDAVVEGTVQHSRDHVRITAQLIYAPTDQHIWAKSYERDTKDALTLEGDIAEEIAREVEVKLTPQEKAALNHHHEVKPEALEAYLQGSYHLYKIGSGSGFEEKDAAVACFHRAISEDPDFALAHVGLACAYHIDKSRDLPGDEVAAKEELRKALYLDPDLAEAHAYLATIYDGWDWDWPNAEREYRRTIELNPNSASAHGDFASFLNNMGRQQEALREAERAQELDPVSSYLADILECQGQHEKAAELNRQRPAPRPDDAAAHYVLFWEYAQKGRYKESIDEAQQVWRLFGFGDVADEIGKAYATRGFRAAVQLTIAELVRLRAEKRMDVPFFTAQLCVLLNEKEEALKWLQVGLEERDINMPGLGVGECWDPLRSDPRFQEIERKVGIPDQRYHASTK